MKYLVLLSLILLCSCHSTPSEKGQNKETDCIHLQKELSALEHINFPLLASENLNDIKSGPEIVPVEEETEQPSQQATFLLRPVPCEIPTGENINRDSLSIKTEYESYPLSTTEVQITITNHSHYEYECGEKYSLAYYNKSKQQWESLPINPVINSILWIFPPQYPTHQQTIRLYTSEVPNRPGKYRIYKSFNRDTKVAYAEFEIVP